jgi:preprotein translocase SecE subunit
VSYKKDQGRYARMIAFWGVVLMVAYGCFHGGGLVTVLDRNVLPREANPVLIEQFPLLGSLKVSTLVALGVTAFAGFATHRVLNRPRLADALIDTEGEMHKVTWPTLGETWTGTVAVAVTVAVLFAYLTVIDAALLGIVQNLLGGAG